MLDDYHYYYYYTLLYYKIENYIQLYDVQTFDRSRSKSPRRPYVR